MKDDSSVTKQIIAAHAVLNPFICLGAALTWSASSLDRLVPATAFQLSLTGLALSVTAGIALMCIQWRIVQSDSMRRKIELQDQAGSAEAHLQGLLAVRSQESQNSGTEVQPSRGGTPSSS